MTKIFDCFPFNNELELLELRFLELEETVDYFVLCESEYTQTHQKKPLYFSENSKRFNRWAEKIIYLEATGMPGFDQGSKMWQNEHYQRNFLAHGLTGRANPSDTILISDVDEIPSVQLIKEYVGRDTFITHEQDLYYYFVNCKQNCRWAGPAQGSYRMLRENSPQAFRNTARAGQNVVKGVVDSWHYSWMPATPERLLAKADSICEGYLIKDKFGDNEAIQAKLDSQADLWNRTESYAQKQLIDLNTIEHPRKLAEWLKKYPQFHKGDINFN